jgi:thermitase
MTRTAHSRALRLALSALIIVSTTVPFSQSALAAPPIGEVEPPTPREVPPRRPTPVDVAPPVVDVSPPDQLMPFTADAYPRQALFTEGVAPLRTTMLANGREALADRLIVRFKPTTTAADRLQVHANAGAAIKMAARPVGQISPTSYLVDVSGASSLQAAARTYRADARIEAVGPDTIVRANETPNDSRFSEQWGMSKIQAPAAWNRTHGGAAAGLVAVLDSGVDENHPDLANRVSSRKDFTGSSSGATDVKGHGTHVAGIIAAVANNSQGVAGVGYSIGLISGKVLDDSGSGSMSQVVSGINWASNYGATVINMSLGASGQGTWDDCDPSWYEDLFDVGANELRDAIGNAWNKGIVLVAAAGNGNSFQQWPGSCPNVLSVANTTSADTRASDSTFGTWVDVAAPGSGILSTAVGGGYVNMSGTSMASPHVAGLAALVRSSCGFSGASAAQNIVNRIKSTADPIAGTGSQWEAGRVNALNAVCFPRPQNVRAGTVGATSIQLLWTDTTPGETRFEVGYTPTGGGVFSSASLPANSQTFTHSVAPGARFDYQVRACDALGCSDWTNVLTLESNVRVLSVLRTGNGTITGSGIACGAGTTNDCSEAYTYGTVVTLTAKPFANTKLQQFWAFSHWEGACSGSTAKTCTVTMTASRSARAVFVDVS